MKTEMTVKVMLMMSLMIIRMACETALIDWEQTLTVLLTGSLN